MFSKEKLFDYISGFDNPKLTKNLGLGRKKSALLNLGPRLILLVEYQSQCIQKYLEIEAPSHLYGRIKTMSRIRQNHDK